MSNEDLGVDILCEEDLDPHLRLTSVSRNVAWAVAWRTRTPRGGLFYAADYGKSLAAYCHSEIDRQDLHACRAGLESEARKDRRVKTARSSVQWNPSTRKLRAQLDCNSAAGPFRLVSAVSSATTELLLVQT
jgi:hypothetical protein